MDSTVLFQTALLLGVMILFTMMVEQLTKSLLPKRLTLGPVKYLVGLVLGVSLIVFGLSRVIVNVEEAGWETTSNILTNGALIILIVGLTVAFIIGFMFKKIGPYWLAGLVIGLAGSTVLANILLRRMMGLEELTVDSLQNEELLFLSLVIGAIITGLGALAMRVIMPTDDYDPTHVTDALINDGLLSAARRRERLQKRKARRG